MQVIQGWGDFKTETAFLILEKKKKEVVIRQES